MTSLNRRQRLALAVPPMFLRIILALTFLWAGLGKFLADMPINEQQAHALTEMGLMGDAQTDEADAPEPAPAPTPEPRVVEPDAPTEPTPTQSETPEGGFDAIEAPGSTPETASGTSASVVHTDRGTRLVAFQPGDPAEDELRRSRLSAILLKIHAAANPPEDRPTLYPPGLATGRLATIQAYSVAIIEIIAGVMLLMGMLTRVWAAALFMIMLGVIWLDSLAPNILSGQVVLGFLPDRALFDMGWVPLLWQFALLAMCGALVFSGPGAISVDNGLFGPDDGDDDDFSDD